MPTARDVTIALDGETKVSGFWLKPVKARACLVLAHGPRAGMAPATTRADHLDDIDLPMLFLQGTRDALAELDLLRPVVARLGPHATLILAQDADHAFHVPARSGRKDAEVLADLLDAAVEWMVQ